MLMKEIFSDRFDGDAFLVYSINLKYDNWIGIENIRNKAFGWI